MLGRAKGSKAEIDVAKRFKAWWSPLEPSEFVRTPLSGGWGGKDLRAGFRASGDIMTTAPRFPFTVEVKRREGWAWKPLIAGKKSPVWGWWEQAVGQAKEMGGIPLLIFRKNREEWNLMLPHAAFLRARPTKTHMIDVVAAWYPDEIGERASGVHPIVVRADWFFGTIPEAWLRVALTFPRK